MSREFPLRPIVGVGAIIFEGGNVLLAQRGKPPSLGNWSVPGGALKLGETLEDACRREVLEETGLDIELISRFTVLDRITRDQWERVRYHYVLVDYVCRPAGGSLNPGGDVSDVKWCPLGELSEIQPMTRGTVQVILDAAEEMRTRNINI